MSSTLAQNVGGGNNNSHLGMEIASQSGTNANVAGSNQRYTANFRKNVGGVYVYPPGSGVIKELVGRQPFGEQRRYMEVFGAGAVLVPAGSQASEIAYDMAQSGVPMEGVEAAHGAPRGVLIPKIVWDDYMGGGGGSMYGGGSPISSAGFSPAGFSPLSGSSGSSSSRASTRFSTGQYGTWGQDALATGTTLAGRKKHYFQTEWDLTMRRKKEQEDLMARKAQLHARKQQAHARMTGLGPFGFWHRWRAGHHVKKARLYNRRARQLQAAQERIAIDRNASVLRGDVKNWREASLTAGGGRGDSRLRGLLRTLRS